MKDLISISDFNFGGLADSKWSGIKNSLYKLTGFDLHGQPGLLRVAQKLTKDSGSTVTELCKASVASSNGNTYFFSADSGKIWERTAAGVWSLVYTTSPAVGQAKCLGAYEYQEYIYWATQSRLHRIKASDAVGAANWTANAVPNWKTFTTTDDSFHPMIEVNLVLYIGDGNLIAQVDAGVFTANALDIKTPLRVKSLGKMGTDLLIGTYSGSVIAKSEIFRWNTWSVSFTNEDTIEEVGINAFLPADNFVFVQAGLAGNIYTYNGEQLELYKKIPGDYSNTKYGCVHPNAVANLNGLILWGFSNGSGNPADQGVYCLGRNSRNYPYVMDMPYPISQRASGEFVLTDVEIGTVLVAGSDLFVAWKNGSSYGIDKLDYSNKLSGAYFESRVMVVNREQLNTFLKFLVAYASLPDNTAINIAYSKNYESYVEATEITDTQRKIVLAEKEGVEASTLQVRVKTTASGNNAPEIESAGVFIR
jgi:hypothetical protein